MSWTVLAEWLFDSPLSGLWPILAIPALSALLSEGAARRLPPTRADWRVAAALAALPGLVMLVLLATAIGRSLLHLHPDGLAHFIQHHFIWLVAPAILLPAALKAVRRSRRLRTAMSFAVGPQTRLAAAGADAGLPVMELPIRSRECFVAGLRRPIAYVSSGAVQALCDAELRAALCHERAHAAGRDPVVLALLAFLADLVPAGGRALLAYREARERHADREAARKTAPLILASALLAFERNSPPLAAGMAGPDPAWRLRAILDLEPASVRRASPGVATALAFNGTLLAWPGAQFAFAILLCSS
jgi:Zn-dependent protease with chaperone function